MKIVGDHQEFATLVPKSLLKEIDNSVNLIDIMSSVPVGITPRSCVAVYDELPPSALVHQAVTKGFTHLVNRASPYFVEEIRLAARMMVEPSGFMTDPMKQIFGENKFEMLKLEFNSSTEKTSVLQKLEDYMKAIPFFERITNNVLTVADELVTNAIFHGPRGPGNVPKNSNLPRTVAVQLDQGKKATIAIGYAEESIVVMCEDPYGTYLPERILNKLDETFKRGVYNAMQVGEGGAGIGCRMMFDMSNGFYSAVDPGKRTIVAYRIPSVRGKKLKEVSPKNMHHFTVSAGKTEKLKANEQKNGDAVLVEFFGQIDEDASLDAIGLAGLKTITFDLGGITYINSVGVRNWLRWIKQASPQAKVCYKKCPKVIIDQINLIDGFLPPGAELESFYVPYHCDSCDHLPTVLMIKGQHFFADGKVSVSDSIKCTNCGKDAELDVVETQYFRFLTRK